MLSRNSFIDFGYECEEKIKSDFLLLYIGEVYKEEGISVDIFEVFLTCLLTDLIYLRRDGKQLSNANYVKTKAGHIGDEWLMNKLRRYKFMIKCYDLLSEEEIEEKLQRIPRIKENDLDLPIILIEQMDGMRWYLENYSNSNFGRDDYLLIKAVVKYVNELDEFRAMGYLQEFGKLVENEEIESLRTDFGVDFKIDLNDLLQDKQISDMLDEIELDYLIWYRGGN